MRNRELEKYKELITKMYVNGEIEDISDKCSSLIPKLMKQEEISMKILHICKPIGERVLSPHR